MADVIKSIPVKSKYATLIGKAYYHRMSHAAAAHLILYAAACVGAIGGAAIIVRAAIVG